MQEPRANLSYNGFDLSHQLKFTSSVGQLLPVYYDFLSPGESVKIKPEMFSRLQDMTSPAFTRLTEHVDFFFVPMNQLFTPFENLFYGVDDFNSDFFNDVSGKDSMSHYPMVQLSLLMEALGQYGNFDVFGCDAHGSATRLFDLLGYGSETLPKLVSSTFNFSINPTLLQAYQKIYYDFYRLSDREENIVSAYNIDRYCGQDYITDKQRIARMCQLHYRPWKKDFYTNNHITPLVQSTSIGFLAGIELNDVSNWLTDYLVSARKFDGQLSNANDSSSVAYTNVGLAGSTSTDTNRSVNTATFRSMFALEKLLEITRRAGKQIDKQQLAHFGVPMPTGISGKVRYLGSNHGVIQVQDVVATTAGTRPDDTVQTLGQVGGRGVGYMDSRQISYKADCHGIIMGIYSCVPESDYSSVGIDKINTYSLPVDYPRPEFDRLGMQPLFAYQGDFTQDAVLNSTILGWQYRYMELKCKHDRISGGLLTNWKNWCTQRVVRNNNLPTYLINPNMLDSIMLVKYLGSSADEDEDGLTYNSENPWQTDPLIHTVHFVSHKVSNMSTYGLNAH